MFTIKDLKPGDKVYYLGHVLGLDHWKNEGRVVSPDGSDILDDKGELACPLSGYKENMEHRVNKEALIVKVIRGSEVVFSRADHLPVKSKKDLKSMDEVRFRDRFDSKMIYYQRDFWEFPQEKGWVELGSDFLDNMKHNTDTEKDIMTVFRDEKLVYYREEVVPVPETVTRKADLRDGDVLVFRCDLEGANVKRIVGKNVTDIAYDYGHGPKQGCHKMMWYRDDLTCFTNHPYINADWPVLDIMTVFRNGVVVYDRPSKAVPAAPEEVNKLLVAAKTNCSVDDMSQEEINTIADEIKNIVNETYRYFVTAKGNPESAPLVDLINRAIKLGGIGNDLEAVKSLVGVRKAWKKRLKNEFGIKIVKRVDIDVTDEVL